MYANRTKLGADELIARCSELQALIRAPRADGDLKVAEGVAMYIVRSAPNGEIANLAMQVMSDLIWSQRKLGASETLEGTLSKLRAALVAAPAAS